MKRKYCSLIATVALVVTCFALGGKAAAATLPKDANTTCPVMTKEDVDPDLYVDYKGRRIYMCCSKCKRHFTQNPEKYLSRLPKADDKGTTKSKAVPSK